MNRILVLATALFVTGPVPAQVTGRVRGSVLDGTGSAVAHARVWMAQAGSATAILSTATTTEGLFQFTAVQAGVYSVTIEAKGFTQHTTRQVKVDAGRETVLARVTLEVAAVTQSVEITADTESVQTSNPELSTTISNEQVRRLPLLDRNAQALILTQPGVTSGRGATVVNGQRTSFGNATLDGVNIQDNFIRSNANDYSPNLLALDQVSEITILTSNASAAHGGGASQITFASPSGGNQFHGAAYWYNRNNALAATNWFANRDGFENPFLNQNQAGGRLSGPILTNKLLFFANYEAHRLRQQSSLDRAILTEDARRGVFTYVDTAGAVRKANLLALAGVPADPAVARLIEGVPGADKINNFRAGDSRPDLLLNTAGYSFLAANNRTRDNVTAKVDYLFSTRHVFTGSYVWNRDIVDRNDVSIANDFSVDPKVKGDNHAKLLSAAWRWNPSPQWTSELRGGFNFAPGVFQSSENFGDFIMGIPAGLFSNPVNTFRSQGRYTDTFNLQENASYNRGSHSIEFGFQMQNVRVERFLDQDITPTYNLAVSASNPYGLSSAQLPGIRAQDLATANNLLATFAGFADNYRQVFNIASRDSGFVPGATFLRNYSFDNYAGYFQDKWRIAPRLTLTLGVRYEYFTVVDERGSLVLLPRVNGDAITTLLSNATLDYAGKSAGSPWYGADRNNFAPNIGLAWDPFGNGRTAVRAGYSVHFVSDDTLRGVLTATDNNSGLQLLTTGTNLNGRITGALPQIPVPALKVPRTFADNYATNPTSIFAIPDPNLRTPYMQQWNLSVQRDVKGTVFELRYVGNRLTKGLRQFDYNQVRIEENGFLPDFLRARNNGFLARGAGLGFDPRYNPAIPGSQQLPVFAQLANGGNLTNATIAGMVERGEAGQLGAYYQSNRLHGAIEFFPSPYGVGMTMLNNYSNSNYHALQFDVRRRMRFGLQFQANYSFSKVLGDALGDNSSRFEPLLDNRNPKIERGRAPFDLNHVIKANWIYELPFGAGKRWQYKPLSKLVSGWSVSSFLNWQSGTPFSILSSRGTLNRTGGTRSDWNTATPLVNKEVLDQNVGFFKTGNGVYFVSRSAVNPADGRGVAADGRAPFSGQLFLNPEPGTIGGLQRRMFSGPWVFGMDVGIQKATQITERQSVELRMEAGNIFNHPTFYVGDESLGLTRFNVNNPTFGVINSMFYDRRVIQFGLYYRF